MNETALWIMIIMYMCGTSRPKERYLEWGGGQKKFGPNFLGIPLTIQKDKFVNINILVSVISNFH